MLILWYLMQYSIPNRNDFFELFCNEILKQNGVRFVGVINNMGRIVLGRYGKDITPLVDEEQHKMCLEHALELLLTKDLDEPLGKIKHIISKREKVNMITIPMNNHIVLVSAEQNASPELIIETAQKLIMDQISTQ